MYEKFRNREVKARDVFYMKPISKTIAHDLIIKYHYLGSKDFMYLFAYGLFDKQTNELVGCATFGALGGVASIKGWFNDTNDHTLNYYELTRLVVIPELNGTNATSYLLGGAIRYIKKNLKEVRAIISLAESTRHVGSIYQVCNFKYYGLTDKKTDFYGDDGTKNKRGSTKDRHGVWIERPRKHRYCYILDDTLEVCYKEEKFPSKDTLLNTYCCNGTNIVYDKRFDEYYTCPICTGYIKRIQKS